MSQWVTVFNKKKCLSHWVTVFKKKWSKTVKNCQKLSKTATKKKLFWLFLTIFDCFDRFFFLNTVTQCDKPFLNTVIFLFSGKFFFRKIWKLCYLSKTNFNIAVPIRAQIVYDIFFFLFFLNPCQAVTGSYSRWLSKEEIMIKLYYRVYIQ